MVLFCLNYQNPTEKYKDFIGNPNMLYQMFLLFVYIYRLIYRHLYVLFLRGLELSKLIIKFVYATIYNDPEELGEEYSMFIDVL
jgi:hypothetical protein